MKDACEPAVEITTLARQNHALAEQIKQLVRAERQLFLSRRELDRQLRHLRALNRFALDAGVARTPADVLRLAAETLFALFPFEQAVGFLAYERGLSPVVVHAVEGREERSAAALGSWARPLPLPGSGELDDAWLGSSAGGAPVPVASLLGCLDELFAEADPGQRPRFNLLAQAVLPLRQAPGSLTGVLAMRRVDTAVPFHDDLPNGGDVAFLDLVARQAAAAAANLRLVDDLRRSHDAVKQAQAAVVAKERLAAVGELAAALAHEVRNPLGVIFNAVGSLRRVTGRRAEVDELLQIMTHEADHLKRLVQDLLDFARPSAPELRPLALQPIISDSIETTRRAVTGAEVVDFHVVVASSMRPVPLDARLMQQALVNLLTNAVQASARGGRVEIKASEVQRDGRAMACVEVADNGPGISRGVAGRIFQPFFTTKASGTGLGLAVVKRIVEVHGGNVDFETTEGKGATFRLFVPASQT